MTENYHLVKKVSNRLLDEISARNYDFFEWRLGVFDRKFKKRVEIEHPKFYDKNGKLININKILSDLLNNGYAIIENLYSDRWVDSAYKKVVRYVKDFKNGKIRKSTLWDNKFGVDKDLLNTGIVRFYNVSRKIPEAKEFAENSLLKYIGELYYQRRMHLQTVISQYNEVSKVPCRGYHIDSHLDQFKSFIYLCDVNRQNGPHTYLKGSNKNSAKTLNKLHQVLRDQITGNYKSVDSTGVSDQEVKKMGFKEDVITGKKGTVLLVDTRGIHQGGTLKRGHRAVFNTYYYLS